MILDTDISNVHVLNFSEPFSGIVTYEELEKHLYSDPDFSDAVPSPLQAIMCLDGGFVFLIRKERALDRVNYFVDIKTKKFDGYLRYGEYFLKGETEETILLTTYLCHPSLANNELSGPLALVAIFNKLKRKKSKI